ncbi:MAG: hypothetical protein ACE5I7_00420 [Candidatus Binatia bacterium]
MEWFLVTLQIYRKVFTRAATLAVRNWAVLGSVFVYSAVMSVTVGVSLRLGILGGFLLSLVWAACVGSFLYLVEMIVRTSKVNLEDFRRSFGMYLWDVVGIMFVFWMFFTLATPALLQLRQGFLVLLCARIAIFVLFNAVPELIYLGHHSALALLSESYAFIAANWIEWFPANLAAAAILYGVWSLPADGVGVYLQRAALGLLVYFTMVMRGFLFIELNGSTHRGRAFRYRAGG